MEITDDKDWKPAVFTCPKCGSHELAELRDYGDVIVRMKSAMIGPDGSITVDTTAPEITDADIQGWEWHCVKCGAVVSNADFQPEGATSLENLGERLDVVINAKKTADDAFVDTAVKQLKEAVDRLFERGGDKLVQVLRLLKQLKEADQNHGRYTTMFRNLAAAASSGVLTGDYNAAKTASLMLCGDSLDGVYAANARLCIWLPYGNDPKLMATLLVMDSDNTRCKFEFYNADNLTRGVKYYLFDDYCSPTEAEIDGFIGLLRDIETAVDELPKFMDRVVDAVNAVLDETGYRTERVVANTEKLNNRKES